MYLSYKFLCEAVNSLRAVCLKIFRNYWVQNSCECKKFRLAFDILSVLYISTTNRRRELKIDCINLLRLPRFHEIEEGSFFFLLTVRIGTETSVFIFLSSVLHNPYSMRQLSQSFSKMDLKNSCLVLLANMDA